MARRAETSRPRPIRFGAGGWRGILAEEFTFARVRSLVHAVADQLCDERVGSSLLVACDHRFLGERLVDTACAVLASRGIPVLRSREPIATPVAAHAVRRRGAALGLVFTASHNPAEYQGVKLFAASGGPVAEPDLRRIERAAGRTRRDVAATSRPAAVSRIECTRGYLRDWSRRVDVEGIRKFRPRVWVDAMHGSGGGVLDVALREAGARVEALRCVPDPLFGGSPPDPRRENLSALLRALRSARGLALGIATDGDADRFAVVDAGGRLLSESEAVALLVDHLARTGRIQRGLALSFATGGLAERVAVGHGLRVERHPLGFSHLALALEAGRADVAGDESGGFAWGRLGPGKDGLLAGGLLVEIMAETRAPLVHRLAALERQYGRSCCARTAVPGSPRVFEQLERLCAKPPARVAGEAAHSEPMADGLRLVLADGFLMLRASTTEPVLRIYAEASGPRRVQRRLSAGRALLGVK